jgi:GNAT superfamily N-acetyltransferase
MEIIKALENDLFEIFKLQKLAYTSEAEIINDFSIQPLTQTFAEIEYEFKNMVFLKAVIDEIIIGSVRFCKKDEICCIYKLIVHPDLQNKGIGKLLMKAAHEYFPDVLKYSLFTGTKSERNISFYKKLGYIPVKEEAVNEKLSLIFFEKTKS